MPPDENESSVAVVAAVPASVESPIVTTEQHDDSVQQQQVTDGNDDSVDEITQQVQGIHIVTDEKDDDDKGDDAVKNGVKERDKIKPTAAAAAATKPKPTIRKEIRTLADWIDKAQNILIVTGAGVSCAAGIPDFRSPGTGLYDNLQTYDLPFPEAVFDLDFFRHKPLPFVQLAQALWPSQHLPTYTHSFLTLLAKRRKLLRNYSQNIDGLEYLAGLPSERLLECHGHFRTSTCIDCSKQHPQELVEADILVHARPTHCFKCHGLVKPDIVFFGEGLPDRFHSLVHNDVKQADLCIVMGTSLQVAPVSMIPNMVGRKTKVALVNRETVVGTKIDLFCRGDCDDIVQELVQALEWQVELDEQHEEMLQLRREERSKSKQGKNKNEKVNGKA